MRDRERGRKKGWQCRQSCNFLSLDGDDWESEKTTLVTCLRSSPPSPPPAIVSQAKWNENIMKRLKIFRRNSVGSEKKLVVNSSQKFVSHSMNSRCRSSSEQVEMLRWGKSFKELSWIYELLLLLQKSSSTVKIQRIIHRDPPSMKTLACSTESFNLKLFDTSLPFSTNERLYAILLNLILPPPLSSSSLQDFVNLKLKPFIFLSCNMKHTAEERERCVRRQTKLKSSKCPQYFDYSSTGGSHIRFSVYLHCEYNDCVDSSNPPTGSEKFEKYWHHNMLCCVVVYAGERNLINATELFFSGIETRIR